MRFYNFDVEGNFTDTFKKDFLVQTNANLECGFWDYYHEFPKQLKEMLDSIPEIVGKYHGVRVSIPNIKVIPVSI